MAIKEHSKSEVPAADLDRVKALKREELREKLKSTDLTPEARAALLAKLRSM